MCWGTGPSPQEKGALTLMWTRSVFARWTTCSCPQTPSLSGGRMGSTRRNTPTPATMPASISSCRCETCSTAQHAPRRRESQG
eukprot:scaffold625_cov420-Prasinococcus_capsulatus_cf.AAC.25